jgi:hypothetical protein
LPLATHGCAHNKPPTTTTSTNDRTTTDHSPRGRGWFQARNWEHLPRMARKESHVLKTMNAAIRVSCVRTALLLLLPSSCLACCRCRCRWRWRRAFFPCRRLSRIVQSTQVPGPALKRESSQTSATEVAYL